MKPEKAKISDVPYLHKLINSFATKGELLPRSLSEIYENLRDFYVIRKGQKAVACSALHVIWEDLAEIKSTAVDENNQKHGIGTILVESCLQEARDLGISTVFCLTKQPEFFEKYGFSRIDKSQLPQKVWGECYRCAQFPNCDEIALLYRFKGKE